MSSISFSLSFLSHCIFDEKIFERQCHLRDRLHHSLGDPPLADKVTSSEHDVIAGQQRVERERLTFQGNRAIAPTDHGILTNGGDCEQTACM